MDSASKLRGFRLRRTALAWWLTGIMAAGGTAVAVPVAVYLWPPAVNQMTIPTIDVQNLDGPDVIVDVGTASALLVAGQRESWPTRLVYSNAQPELIIQRADDGRILFQEDVQAGPPSRGLRLIVRWPGLVWRA